MTIPTIKAIALDTWAGRRYHPVEVLGVTPKKLWVRILAPDGALLPGRRFARCGDQVLIPKHAVCEVKPAQYAGHVDGEEWE